MEEVIRKDKRQWERDSKAVKNARLRRDREYRKERRNAESEAEKSEQLYRDRENRKVRRQLDVQKELEEVRVTRERETVTEREMQLERERNNRRLKRTLASAQETVTERENRLEQDRANKKKRRQEQRTELMAQNSVADRALESMFEDKMKKLGFSVCLTCKRKEMTIHSTLNIGISGDMQKLEGQQLREFQLIMEPVKFIIVDEYSMVGCRLLGKIDQRCREGKPGGESELFGGLYVYFLGDIKQLPPVMDRCPFARGMTTGIAINGRAAYCGIRKCFTLGDSQRQAGTDTDQVNFREVLDRLSLGQSTEEDWLRIDQRTASKIPDFSEKFKGAFRLFPTNELAAAYNEHKLRDLGQPVAKIQARQYVPCASLASSDFAQGLLPELLVSIGSRVMLRSNLWTRKGLVNGTVGTVRDIVYRLGERPSTNGLPVCIMIDWDKYSGPLFDSSFPLWLLRVTGKKMG